MDFDTMDDEPMDVDLAQDKSIKLFEMNKDSVVVFNFCVHQSNLSLPLLNLRLESLNVKKTNTIAKELILPAAIDLVSRIIGENSCART